MEIGPTSITSITFKTTNGDDYKIALKSSSIYYYKNQELITVKDVPTEYNSINLYETTKNVAKKLGVTTTQLKLHDKE